MTNLSSKTSQRVVFWSRFAGYVSAGTIAPIAVFASKFGLFKEEQYSPVYDELGNTINATAPALNGWGIVSCILIGFSLISILKEVINAYTGYSLPKQVLTGIVKSIIPLAIAFGICYFLDGVIDDIKYCLLVIIITKIIAIPLNPLPKWRYERKCVENYDDFINTITTYLKDKYKKEV